MTVPVAAAGRVGETLEALGAVAVSRTDAGATTPSSSVRSRPPNWTRQRISGLFEDTVDRDAIKNTLRAVAGQALLIETTFLADRDWELSGREQFHPFRVTEHLWVRPPWCPPVVDGAVNLIIAPGLAFGTGTHTTTQLCLTALADLPLTGRSLLDWGCGSGILAVAALCLGARSATGVDVDPRALSASIDNAKRNAVAKNLAVLPPDEVPADLACDVVVANIVADTLIALAPVLSAHLRTGGRLLLSGILPGQARRVSTAFTGYNFASRQRDEWVLLEGTRSTAAY